MQGGQLEGSWEGSGRANWDENLKEVTGFREYFKVVPVKYVDGFFVVTKEKREIKNDF